MITPTIKEYYVIGEGDRMNLEKLHEYTESIHGYRVSKGYSK